MHYTFVFSIIFVQIIFYKIDWKKISFKIIIFRSNYMNIITMDILLYLYETA